jgi:hypothetical protein
MPRSWPRCGPISGSVRPAHSRRRAPSYLDPIKPEGVADRTHRRQRNVHVRFPLKPAVFLGSIAALLCGCGPKAATQIELPVAGHHQHNFSARECIRKAFSCVAPGCTPIRRSRRGRNRPTRNCAGLHSDRLRSARDALLSARLHARRGVGDRLHGSVLADHASRWSGLIY